MELILQCQLIYQKSFFIDIRSVQFSRSITFYALRPDGLQHARLPCPSPPPRTCSNSCPLSRWCRWWEVEHQSVNFEWKPGTELIILQTHIVATVYSLSHVQLCCDPRDCSPLGSSVRELPRPEYWSGLSWPMPGDFPNQRWTHISCIGRCILHHWAARKAHKLVSGK